MGATLPHVVGLLATQNRPELAHRAAHLFFEQDYAGTKSLVVYDDGDDYFQACEELDDLNVVYHSRASLPAKRNQMVKHVNDPDAIYVVWDDDDYHGPGRIQRQVNALQSSNAQACLLKPFLYFNQVTGVVRRCIGRDTFSPSADATLAFRHTFWQQRNWDETLDPGSGFQMTHKRGDSIVYIDGVTDYVVVWHGAHRFHQPPDLFTSDWTSTTIEANEITARLATRSCSGH